MSMNRIMMFIHLWVGLLLGLLVLIWMASGVVMSWFDIDKVTGRDRASPAATVVIDREGNDISLDQFMDVYPHTEQLIFRNLAGQTVLEMKDMFGDVVLIDIATGEVIVIGEEEALRIAEADYSGAWTTPSISLVDEPHYEIRGRDLPLWRVDVHDDRRTRLYISPSDGEIVARRNAIWRFYDFFWMLHILDFEERGNTNNILLKASSAAGLIFAVSGLWLVVVSLRSGKYGASLRRQKNKV